MRSRVFTNHHNGNRYLYMRCQGVEVSFIQLVATGAVHFTSRKLTPELHDQCQIIRTALSRPDVTRTTPGAQNLFGVLYALSDILANHSLLEQGLQEVIDYLHAAPAALPITTDKKCLS